MRKNSETLDVNIARILHLKWMFDLKQALTNEETLSPVDNHMECDLGLWLKASGLKKFHQFDAVQRLDSVHTQFHDKVSELMSNRTDKTTEEINLKLESLTEVSREIIYLLTELELASTQMQERQEKMSHPLSSLLDYLMNTKTQRDPEQNLGSPLQVSHVRLKHVQWTENMPSAFKNRGRHTSLATATECDLGIWTKNLHSQHYNSIQEIKKLDELHVFFHEVAQNTVDALRKNEDQQAEIYYSEMKEMSREIVYLLSLIEYIMKDSDAIESLSTHFI
ncbi:MAG: CZB domain-containing protein [SAR324 cluster bacterium]|nr:CZB domain-containing protein [SAR324 cluster bacterium]